MSDIFLSSYALAQLTLVGIHNFHSKAFKFDYIYISKSSSEISCLPAKSSSLVNFSWNTQSFIQRLLIDSIYISKLEF